MTSRTSTQYAQAQAIVKATGSHADAGGKDRWGMPTYQLRVRGVVLVGCRYDRPAETIRRVGLVSTDGQETGR